MKETTSHSNANKPGNANKAGNAKKASGALELASRVAQLVSIADVTMLRGSFEFRDAAAHPETDARGFTTKVREEHIVDKRGITVRPRMDVEAKFRPHVKRARFVRVSAEFEILYRWRSEARPDRDAIGAFARVNGVYNVWPYLREFVQSSTVRLGVQPLTLPTLTAERAAMLAGP
jgi:hypothetical protein